MELAYTSKGVFDSASQMGWQLRPYSTPYTGIGTCIGVAPTISARWPKL